MAFGLQSWLVVGAFPLLMFFLFFFYLLHTPYGLSFSKVYRLFRAIVLDWLCFVSLYKSFLCFLFYALLLNNSIDGVTFFGCWFYYMLAPNLRKLSGRG